MADILRADSQNNITIERFGFEKQRLSLRYPQLHNYNPNFAVELPDRAPRIHINVYRNCNKKADHSRYNCPLTEVFDKDAGEFTQNLFDLAWVARSQRDGDKDVVVSMPIEKSFGSNSSMLRVIIQSKDIFNTDYREMVKGFMGGFLKAQPANAQKLVNQ